MKINRLLIVLTLFFILSCSGNNITYEDIMVSEDEVAFKMMSCATTEAKSLGADRADKLVTSNDTIYHRIRYKYFTNGAKKTFDEQYFIQRTKVLNYNYRNTNRVFIYDGLTLFDKTPADYDKSLTMIEAFETERTKRSDLREVWLIELYEFWGDLFEDEDALDVFVYDNVYSNYAGVAEDIIGTYCAVLAENMDPILILDKKKQYKTLEHEIGHLLGSYHTHHNAEKDTTDGFNTTGGDYACDTPKTPADIRIMMDDNCELKVPIFQNMDKACIRNSTRNYMSYIDGWCREVFTKDQVRIWNEGLKTSRDLRATSPNFDNLLYLKLPPKLDTMDIKMRLYNK